MSGRTRQGRASRVCPIARPKYLSNPTPVLKFAIHDLTSSNPFQALADDDENRLNWIVLSPYSKVLTSCKSANEFLQNAADPTSTKISKALNNSSKTSVKPPAQPRLAPQAPYINKRRNGSSIDPSRTSLYPHATITAAPEFYSKFANSQTSSLLHEARKVQTSTMVKSAPAAKVTPPSKPTAKKQSKTKNDRVSPPHVPSLSDKTTDVEIRSYSKDKLVSTVLEWMRREPSPHNPKPTHIQRSRKKSLVDEVIKFRDILKARVQFSTPTPPDDVAMSTDDLKRLMADKYMTIHKTTMPDNYCDGMTRAALFHELSRMSGTKTSVTTLFQPSADDDYEMDIDSDDDEDDYDEDFDVLSDNCISEISAPEQYDSEDDKTECDVESISDPDNTSNDEPSDNETESDTASPSASSKLHTQKPMDDLNLALSDNEKTALLAPFDNEVPSDPEPEDEPDATPDVDIDTNVTTPTGSDNVSDNVPDDFSMTAASSDANSTSDAGSASSDSSDDDESTGSGDQDDCNEDDNSVELEYDNVESEEEDVDTSEEDEDVHDNKSTSAMSTDSTNPSSDIQSNSPSNVPYGPSERPTSNVGTPTNSSTATRPRGFTGLGHSAYRLNGCAIDDLVPENVQDEYSQKHHNNSINAKEVARNTFFIRAKLHIHDTKHVPTMIKKFYRVWRQVDPTLVILPLDVNDSSLNSILHDETHIPEEKDQLSKWAGGVRFNTYQKLEFNMRLSNTMSMFDFKGQVFTWCKMYKHYVTFDSIASERTFSVGWICGLHEDHTDIDYLKDWIDSHNQKYFISSKFKLYPRRIYQNIAHTKERRITRAIAIDGGFDVRDDLIDFFYKLKWTGKYSACKFVQLKINEIFTAAHMLRAIEMQNEHRNNIYCKSIEVHNRDIIRTLPNGTDVSFTDWARNCTIKGIPVFNDVIGSDPNFVKFVYNKKDHKTVLSIMKKMYTNVAKKFGDDAAIDLFQSETVFDKNFKTRESEKLYLEENAQLFAANPQDIDSDTSFRDARKPQPVYGKAVTLPDVTYKSVVSQDSPGLSPTQASRVEELEQQVTDLASANTKLKADFSQSLTQEVQSQLKPVYDKMDANDKATRRRIKQVVKNVDSRWEKFEKYMKTKEKEHKKDMKRIVSNNHTEYMNALKNLQSPSAPNNAPGENQ